MSIYVHLCVCDLSLLVSLCVSGICTCTRVCVPVFVHLFACMHYLECSLLVLTVHLHTLFYSYVPCFIAMCLVL